MTYWETAEENPSAPAHEREFARVWKALPKTVFSTTLEKVEGNYRLLRGGLVEQVGRLKQEPGEDLGVGGAGLAAGLVKRGLIDEYRLFVNPVLLGGGTPYFPAVDRPGRLELIETFLSGRLLLT